MIQLSMKIQNDLSVMLKMPYSFFQIFKTNPEGPNVTEVKIAPDKAKRKPMIQRPEAQPPLPPDQAQVQESKPRGMSKPLLKPLRATTSNPVGLKKSSLESSSPNSPSTPTTPTSMFSSNNHTHNFSQLRKSLRPTVSCNPSTSSTPVQGA